MIEKKDRTLEQQRITEIVRDCVNEYDPESLLKMGCPADEYEPEIKDIAAAITGNDLLNRHGLWIAICNTLHWYFGDHYEPVLYWRKHLELADMMLADFGALHSELFGQGPDQT